MLLERAHPDMASSMDNTAIASVPRPKNQYSSRCRPRPDPPLRIAHQEISRQTQAAGRRCRKSRKSSLIRRRRPLTAGAGNKGGGAERFRPPPPCPFCSLLRSKAAALDVVYPFNPGEPGDHRLKMVQAADPHGQGHGGLAVLGFPGVDGVNHHMHGR